VDVDLLHRVWSGSDSRTARLNVSYFTGLRDDAKVEVVGEYYRQERVRQARPPGPADLPPGMPPPPPGYFKALLIAEPTNKYDRNAIMVCLWSGGTWSQCGYLSRTDAVSYQPVLRWLAVQSPASPPSVACDAALKPERDAVGVVLHLGTPGECIVELATHDRSPLGPSWVGKGVVFTGQGSTSIAGVPIDRHAQRMLARWAGAEAMPRLTKKTDALIVANPAESASNLQRAREYGIQIIEEPRFVVSLGIPAELVARVSGRWARI
jgi:hypothetical protein